MDFAKSGTYGNVLPAAKKRQNSEAKPLDTLCWMRRPFLLVCAGLFNGISQLAFIPTVAVCVLPMKSRLLWPVAIVLFPFTIPFLFIWSVAQVISSLCAFTFHQQIGTRAAVQSDGLYLNAELTSQFIAWHDINVIRRVYDRFFPNYEARFKDNCAYQVNLNSGEVIYIDFTDEMALRSQADGHGVVTEGFDSHLSAAEFEKNQEVDNNQNG